MIDLGKSNFSKDPLPVQGYGKWRIKGPYSLDIRLKFFESAKKGALPLCCLPAYSNACFHTKVLKEQEVELLSFYRPWGKSYALNGSVLGD